MLIPGKFLPEHVCVGVLHWHGDGSCLRHGQRKVDGSALPQLAFEPEFATMGLHQMLDDRQPQAGPTELTRAGFIHPVEAFGDAWQIDRRDADASIDDPHVHEARRPVFGT